MKKLLIALFGAALVLGACGGDEPAPAEPAPEETPAEETPAPEETPAEETASGEFDAAAAEASYQTCAGCHGAELQGASAPAIAGLSAEEVLSAIHEGRTGMPPGLVKDEAAENLAAWIAAQ